MVAAVAAPPVRAEQGAPTLLALLNCAVLIICKFILWAHILAAALETKDTTLAVVAWQERWARYTEEGLWVEEEKEEVTFMCE